MSDPIVEQLTASAAQLATIAKDGTTQTQLTAQQGAMPTKLLPIPLDDDLKPFFNGSVSMEYKQLIVLGQIARNLQQIRDRLPAPPPVPVAEPAKV